MKGAEFLKIYGHYYRVKAEVHNIEVLSSHADQNEIIDWLKSIENVPERVFITHGESHAADALRVRLKDEFGWFPEIPELYQIEEL